MISDYFTLAVKSILHRKLRSWLTIIGIVIGIAAIIALISLSLGLQSTIEKQFEAFGSDRILVAAKGFQGPGTISEGLTDDDVDVLENLGIFISVSSGSARPGEVEFHDEIKFPLVFGGRNGKELLESGTDIMEGRYIEDNDGFSALIGSRISDGLFDDKIRIRNKIKIAGHDFRIVGILESVGNQQDDNTIYLPLDKYREVFEDENNIGFISAQVKPGIDIATAEARVERALEKSRSDENFEVVTPTQILEQINQILGIVQIVLVGIAGISLLVGGIGIMNAMYTTVLERTKEIGTMKAVGARNSQILSIFIFESGIMGFVGGFIGAILGTIISLSVGRYSTQAGFLLSVELNIPLMIFGVLFAVVVGIISGAYPAIQASRLRPVDALRYE